MYEGKVLLRFDNYFLSSILETVAKNISLHWLSFPQVTTRCLVKQGETRAFDMETKIHTELIQSPRYPEKDFH